MTHDSRLHDRLFIMVDLETTGPVYGKHSMVELGAAVGSRELGVFDRFSGHLTPISKEGQNSRRSYLEALRSGLAPASTMTRFRAFTRRHQERGATFVARPAAFDWPWIVYYAWTYLGENPFGFKALCASSWLEARGMRFDVKIPHIAMEDAEIQLRYFLDHLEG